MFFRPQWLVRETSATEAESKAQRSKQRIKPARPELPGKLGGPHSPKLPPFLDVHLPAPLLGFEPSQRRRVASVPLPKFVQKRAFQKPEAAQASELQTTVHPK